MWPNLKEIAALVTFTEETLNEKLIFLRKDFLKSLTFNVSYILSI